MNRDGTCAQRPSRSGGLMFAVMLAIDQAVEESGFDDRAYDFGSALHEALTDSLCSVRWTRREAAFPDDCLDGAEDDETG